MANRDSKLTRRGTYGQRPSKSADEARRLEFVRIWAMTPKERAILALDLGRRMRRLTNTDQRSGTDQ